ncbi:MAG TPA: crossover junction endodeoxyribonuclease RuvC [Gammaproteobacteria bacterium]|nr:crossover junction endodeoxyribonuclease RuvC [Gammaproteobacteria bacterium]
MTTIIGIDPGSRRTGYGIIQLDGNRNRYITSGYINLTSYPPLDRLRQIYLALKTIIENHQPDEAAIEQVFMHENPNSALKLGQARGAAIVALSMPVNEYSARQVKKSVVGHGAAAKDQVQFMVKRLLNITGTLQVDAADALAIALCHAQSRALRKLGLPI